MRFVLVVALLSVLPALADDEDPASSKRLQSLALIKKVRAKVTTKEGFELDFRAAVLLDEEATSLEARGKREQAAMYRAEEQELLERLQRDAPDFRADEVKAKLRTEAPPSPAPSGAVVDLDEALRVARVDYDAELARSPLPALPAGFDVALTCCVETNVLGAPVGVVVTLTLPALANAPAADRPTTSLGGYSVTRSGEAKVLRRPDFAELRGTAVKKAAAAQRAAELAYAKLSTLDGWRTRSSGFSTSLVASSGQTWSVYFRAADASATANVDLARGVVTRITVER